MNTTIVIPCYNEGERLNVDTFETFSRAHPHIGFLFVDDGSLDRTKDVLKSFKEKFRCDVLSLSKNSGKAEAVRQGFLKALLSNPQFVGFWDADLATPLTEIPRFIELLTEKPKLSLVMGARVKLLGRTIERNAARHYLGRIFATAASLTLGIAVYDTQCGAKLFRVTNNLNGLFTKPFLTRWLFDIEIMARMMQSASMSNQLVHRQKFADESIYELPLLEWRDIKGSKVKPADFFIAFFELLRLYRRYPRRVRHSPERG